MAISLALALLIGSPALRRRPAAYLFALTLIMVGVWMACGGGGGSLPQTPAPAVSLSSTSVPFSSQSVGVTTAPTSVTLTNAGTASLSIASVSLTGTNWGDFSQTNTCGSSIAVGANCSISVTFTPSATGARSASVSIADNASGSPQTIALSGTGVNAPSVIISYPSLNFGSQDVGSSSGAQNDTILNTGTAALNITNVALTGTNPGDFSQTNNCSSVTAGTSCTIAAKFTPSATGARSASVSITDNASGSPHTISLSGTGTLTPTPAGTYTVDVFAVGGNFHNYLMFNVTVN